MTDDEIKKSDKLQKQQKNNKRSRKENQNRDGHDAMPLTSFKKIHLDLTDLGGPASSSSNDSNSTTEAGVFDFTWMKEEGADMKSDLKFEDAFASSLDATNVSEIFEPDDRLIVDGKCGSVGADGIDNGDSAYGVMQRKHDGVDDEEDDGLECVWDSLLNQQPLSNIEFEAGGF